MSEIASALRDMQPDPTFRTRAPKLSDEEFRAIKVARAKGCSFKQILGALDGRYKTVTALTAAYKKWLGDK